MYIIVVGLRWGGSDRSVQLPLYSESGEQKIHTPSAKVANPLASQRRTHDAPPSTKYIELDVELFTQILLSSNCLTGWVIVWHLSAAQALQHGLRGHGEGYLGFARIISRRVPRTIQMAYISSWKETPRRVKFKDTPIEFICFTESLKDRQERSSLKRWRSSL